MSEKKPNIYEESSQYQHWRFSPEQLWDIRNRTTEAAIDRVKRNVQEEMEANAEDQLDKREYLSAKEEFQLCQFYEKQIQLMSKPCRFSDMVMATAVIYMKRFYLYNTVMDYHPKDILLTCLFLATKSESERVSIEEFGKNLRLKTTKSVLNLEFTVSQGLKFQYYVHHPYRPAYGFFLDMQNGFVDIDLLKETYKRIDKAIADIVLSDLPLIFQPSQLGLAAFMLAGKDNGFDEQVKNYIKQRFGDQEKELLSIMDKIIGQLKLVVPVTREEATKIDYKLKLCMNPAMNPESALYKKRLAQREQEKMEKRAKISDSPSSSSSSSSSTPSAIQ